MHVVPADLNPGAWVQHPGGRSGPLRLSGYRQKLKLGRNDAPDQRCLKTDGWAGLGTSLLVDPSLDLGQLADHLGIGEPVLPWQVSEHRQVFSEGACVVDEERQQLLLLMDPQSE